MEADTVYNGLISLGAIAGVIAFLWKAFESYAAKSANSWDDKIVKIVNTVAVPIVQALEKNAAVTAENTAHVAANTSATVVNSEMTAPGKA